MITLFIKQGVELQVDSRLVFKLGSDFFKS